MKKFLIAANWKMNSTPEGFDGADSPYQPHKNVDVVVFPTFLDLRVCIDVGIVTGGQCGRPEKTGAYTGDISMQMLRDIGCTYVLCGHSDRRQFHHESSDFVAAEAAAAINAGLIPIICIGETAAEREAGKIEEVLQSQLAPVQKNSELRAQSSKLILAYEPVWAISRGDPNKPAATPKDAEEMHILIRSMLPKEMKNVRILYGGSMKGDNAEELLKLPDVDGGLVGGASLKPDEFRKIVEMAAALTVAH